MGVETENYIRQFLKAPHNLEYEKTFSPFMINRYLSMGEDFLPLVNHFQNYVVQTMPHGIVYRFYCDLLPKKKMYLKYIKGKKDKFNKEIIDIYCRILRGE